MRYFCGPWQKFEDRFASISEFAQRLQQALHMSNNSLAISGEMIRSVAEHDKKAERSVLVTPPGPTIPAQPFGTADQTVADVASAALDPTIISPPRSASPASARHLAKNMILVVLACAIIIAGVISFGVYQNNVYRTNAAATASANGAATVNAVIATSQANDAATVAAATAVAGATATVVTANPYPFTEGNGTLALYDPLSRSNYWTNG